MARGPEGRFWQTLRGRLQGSWHAQRLEDAYSAGIPDVSWAARGVEGFIELKALNAWPPRRLNLASTCHLSSEQVGWLESRGEAGSGRCFVFLRAGRRHVLWHWPVARRLLESLPADEALGLAFEDPVLGIRAVWDGPVPVEEFLAVLTGPAAASKN